MNALEQNDLEGTGYWLKQALDSEDDNIKTLAKFQLDKIARTIIDSVKNNINTISIIYFSTGEISSRLFVKICKYFMDEKNFYLSYFKMATRFL